MARNRTKSAVAAAIEAAGLDTKTIAEAAGVNRVSIYNWRRGAIPHVETRPKLARALGITVDQLMGVQPIPPSENNHVEIDAMHQHTGPIAVTIKGNGFSLEITVSHDTARRLIRTLLSD